MALIETQDFSKEGPILATTMTASDTAIVGVKNKRSTLIIDNSTGGDLTINIVGNTATFANCSGIGEIDLTGGVSVTVVDGDLIKFPLNPYYKQWLGDGNLTITGGTGAVAYILEV